MREIISVFGKTGSGKSEWLKQFSRGCPRLFVFDPTETYPCTFVEDYELIEMDDNGLFRPGNNFQYAVSSVNDIDLICDLSFVRENVFLILEEASMFLNNKAAIPDYLRDIMLLGRHRNVGLAMVAQRPIYIPATIRSQCTRIVSYTMHDKLDVRELTSWFGESALELPYLPDYYCLDRTGIEPVKRYKIDL